MPCVDANYSWQPIETAPDLERIMVLGVQKAHGTCRAYWWYHEDAAQDGRAIEHPDALFWAPLIIPPFPAKAIEAGTGKTEGLDPQGESAAR